MRIGGEGPPNRTTGGGCCLATITIGAVAICSLLLGGRVLAQYINGPAPPVTAGQFCAEMRGWIGMSRAGHTLRSVSCSGGGHEFTVHIRID